MIEVQRIYRDLKTHREPWRLKVHVHLKGSGTLSELIEFIRTEHPDADLENVHLALTFLSYYTEPTQEDIAEREAWMAAQDARHKEKREKWERETYAALKAKFEPEATP